LATQERTRSETIYQACIGLRNNGRQISRMVLTQITGLKMGVVDDHVTRMIEKGLLRRVAAGFVEVVAQFEPNRPIYKGMLPDGMVKLEIGDDVLTLTPGEAQVVGAALMGEANIYNQLRVDREQLDRMAKLEREVQLGRKRMDLMVKEVLRLRQQPMLAFD
jgi:hypothetical protein